MKIALIGATGMIGQRILQEALNRGHRVTAIVRASSPALDPRPNLGTAQGDIFDPASIEAVLKGQGYDVLVSAYGPGQGDANQVVKAAESLLEAVSQMGHPPRLLVVGGAASLEVSPGLQLIDTPEFPDAWKPVAKAHKDALAIFRNSKANWTVLSPAAMISPGERTGKYRTGTDQLVRGDRGESKISAEDYAVALLDEIEQPRFVGQRFTVAY